MSKCMRCKTNEVNVILDESGRLCNDCYNEVMAEELEVELTPLPDTFTAKDLDGASHLYKVERNVYPQGISMEANEDLEYGYKFAVDGELDCDQEALFNRLIEKAKEGLAEKHIVQSTFPTGETYDAMQRDRLKGFIEYDKNNDNAPLLIVDGKPYTWEEIGRMLTAYEGFQIKMEMFDLTEDAD